MCAIANTVQKLSNGTLLPLETLPLFQNASSQNNPQVLADYTTKVAEIQTDTQTNYSINQIQQGVGQNYQTPVYQQNTARPSYAPAANTPHVHFAPRGFQQNPRQNLYQPAAQQSNSFYQQRPRYSSQLQGQTQRVMEYCGYCGIWRHNKDTCRSLMRNTTEQNVKRQPPVCYNCNESGHFAMRCTKEPQQARRNIPGPVRPQGNA